ncbi:hypothetical protein F5I97DRAFT_1862130 [Phlebopus sp. FC_14]|nr:hypothetical protein F5I97DRAFT_1862130 [Phlebopus sp. FC_14]
MVTGPDIDPTTKYRLNLPFALHSVSPSLSALHATRALTHHPETFALRSTHCPKCGIYLFHGVGQTQLGIVRRKKKKRLDSGVYSVQKAFQRTCHACGASISCESSTPAVDQNVPAARVKSDVTPSTTPSTNQTTLQTEPPIRPGQVGPNPASTSHLSSKNTRQKTARRKASTLRDMLAHERSKAETSKARKMTDSQGGLVSFLQNL